jgi:hypothetical protein
VQKKQHMPIDYCILMIVYSLKPIKIMEADNLNIHIARKQLTLSALNKFENCKQAAKALGISLKTLQRDKKLYGIVRTDGGQYYFEEPKKIQFVPLLKAS